MKRILLVEDDLIIARIYRRKLEEAGFRVLLAEDGLAAIRLIPDFRPDLIILDIMLPKLNGVEVLKWVRQDSEAKSTRVVVLSNAFLNELWDQITSLGVQEILLKSSVSPNQLVATLQKVLDQPAAAVVRTPSSGKTPDAERRKSAPAHQPAAPPAESSEPASTTESDTEFSDRIQREFLDQIPAISKSLQDAFGAFIESPDTDSQLQYLQDLRRKVGFLTHMTGMAGWQRMAQLSNALEALLYELDLKPGALTESTRHTISTTIRVLMDSLAHGSQVNKKNPPQASVLIVDDDLVSSRALVTTLARGDVRATAFSDPLQALQDLRSHSYHVVLLDINLPSMSGISLCEQLRQIPMHQSTPVIFMTSYPEFGPKTHAILARGDDLIGKPVMPIDLTVRVLARIVERRLAG